MIWNSVSRTTQDQQAMIAAAVAADRLFEPSSTGLTPLDLLLARS